MRTQVGIIGAGPAGLLLGHMLDRLGIDSVILEARDRFHVENRIRAGVLEHQVRELLIELGLGGRMQREGLLHHGIHLAFDGGLHRIDFERLTGKGVTVYGQHEVVRDLVAARLEAGSPLVFEAQDVSLHDLQSDRPAIRYRHHGREEVLSCDVIAGCDGFHGISRPSIPDGVLTTFERVYPFAWLGILANARPASDELIYAHHDEGFALLSMRSPTVSRLYLQCRPDEDLAEWPDARIWDALHQRLEVPGGPRIEEGEITQKSVTAMRSFVTEPMQFGRLFLAGDAAHIVPPTGAKGMNLAVADIRILARGLEAFLKHGRREVLDGYSATCLRRIWKAQRFSWWMTSLLHRFDDASPFDHRRQRAELDYVTSSHAAATALAENYVGLPFEH